MVNLFSAIALWLLADSLGLELPLVEEYFSFEADSSKVGKGRQLLYGWSVGERLLQKT